MKKTYYKFLILFLLAAFFGVGFYTFFTFECPNIIKKHKKTEVVIPQSDVDENFEVIRVILQFHSSNYFIYNGMQIGFQYELLKELEKELGINLEIKIETDPKKILIAMYWGRFDIAIMDLNQSAFLLPLLAHSIPHSHSYSVLVSGNNSDTASDKRIFISNDFFVKLFFNEDSPYRDFPVQKKSTYSTEELFEQLDNGEIQYLICDYNQAITLMPFYSNAQILEKVGPQFERRWFFNKKNLQLNENINHWLIDFKKTKKYQWILRKYFTQESALLNASFAQKDNKKISRYDDIIKKYAQQFEFDWRFVAAIMCQESKFLSGLTGNGGSFGLMQLMPATMEYYGVSEEDGEEANIRAGIKHLNSVRKSFDDIEKEEEKLYFIVASYNAGRGHIFDAQRLCAKNGEDFNVWQNVAKYLKMKSQREIVSDEVVKSGYFPGAHTVKYTQQVMNRYNAYKVVYPQ